MGVCSRPPQLQQSNRGNSVVNYSDSRRDFKLAYAAEWAGISSRNIGIFAMWLSGLGIPPSFHEFVTAVFVAGNWDEVEEEEITLKRLARAISPGTDSDRSILRAYERLKKSSIEFYKWQEQQKFAPVPRETTGKGRYTKSVYKFPHFHILRELFNLPLTFTQKQIRAEVSKVLGDLCLPPPKPRERKKRKAESVAASNARILEELVGLTSPMEAGLHLSEAWRASLGDAVVDEIIRSLSNH